eukprot:m51a1_g8875 putative serine threonine protein (621) ;mRNA; f:620496-624118
MSDQAGSPKRTLLSPLAAVFGSRKAAKDAAQQQGAAAQQGQQGQQQQPQQAQQPQQGTQPARVASPPSADPVPSAPEGSDDMAVEVVTGDGQQAGQAVSVPVAVAPFLASLTSYVREEISPDIARQWLQSRGLPAAAVPPILANIPLHTFLLADGMRVSFCSFFFAIRNAAGDTAHMQLIEQPAESVTVTLQPAPAGSASSEAEPMDQSPSASGNPVRAPKAYAVNTSVSVIGKRNVSPALLRDHLNASAATMACLRDAERPVWKGSDIAMRIHYLLKEHFVEIAGYKYEVGAPSHRWTGVIGGLSAPHLMHIANECNALMKDEPTLLRIKAPVYVIGDLHGNYKDFVYFAKSFGLWNSAEFVPAKFLFLGDYVDRGPHSIETLAFVLALKCRYPDKIFLLRGNHECAEINGDEELYLSGSFKTQCKLLYGHKDGEELWRAFNKCFEMMPLAAVVDKKIFCVHAGIPRFLARNPTSEILDIIASVRRPPCLTDDFVFDLLWSDPATPAEERAIGMDGFPPGFGRNSRGPATCVFGKEAVRLFCERSGCSHMIRAHQSPKLGIDVAKNAQILTVFSSSHYCGGYNRAAAVLIYAHKLDIIVSNPEAPEPDIFIANEDYRTT